MSLYYIILNHLACCWFYVICYYEYKFHPDNCLVIKLKKIIIFSDLIYK